MPFLEEGVSLEEHLFGHVVSDEEKKKIDEKNVTAGIEVEKNETIETITKEVKHHPEPTAEELKQRLNQLLKGDM